MLVITAKLFVSPVSSINSSKSIFLQSLLVIKKNCSFEKKIMKKFAIVFSVLILCLFASGQKPGSLDTKTLNEIKTKYKQSLPDQGMINAVIQNDLKSLSVNNQNAYRPDSYFKYKVKTGSPADQKSSGRCWMFASMNTLRPAVIEKYSLKNFEFSYNYLFFYDQLEKANLFLESIISSAQKPMDDKQVDWLFKNPIGDGGVWSGFANLVQKYGLVPSVVMPETYHSNNTSQMSAVLTTKLREQGLKIRELAKSGNPAKVNEQKMQALAEIYKILAYTLGEPPMNFQYRFIDKNNQAGELKTYTPMEFYKEIFNINFGDFVMIMNDPSREYYKLYEIDLDRNIQEGINWKYINLPAEEIKKFALAALKDNTPLYFSCDVGKQYHKGSSTLDIDNYSYQEIFDIPFTMGKKERIMTFESGSTHGMNLIGVDTDVNDKPTKWLIENSWGNIGLDGNLIMTDEWFSEYMFRLVINQKYLSAEALKVLEQKPILLPSWDPMFKCDE